jgi:hypothetical protein
MSKRLMLLNAALVGVAVFLGVWLARDLGRSRPLPPPPPVKAPAAAAQPEEPKPAAAPADSLGTYNVIVAKYLFSASRSEGQTVAAPTPPPPPPPPKPMLLGVVVDGPESRAYLEDPVTKRVIGYRIGDTVAGGKLQRVTADRVQIAGRPDGTIDVLLRDPAKPRPPAAQDGPQTPGAAPRVESRQPPAAGPGRPVPPRAVRRLVPEREADR